MIDLLTTILSTTAGAIIALILVLALLSTIIGLFVFAIRQGREVSLWPPRIGPREIPKELRIEGRRLFQYEGYYPVDIEPQSNRPSLNPETYVRALEFFLRKDKFDRLAAMDLVYLRQDNKTHSGDLLPSHADETYNRLIDKYDLTHFESTYAEETRRLFRNIKRIVNDIGDTLRGIGFEIILHDVRNPLRSIIAISNSEEVSQRSLHGPSTRFVVQYVKHQGKHLLEAFNDDGRKVGYPKQFTSTKKVKATTTP